MLKKKRSSMSLLFGGLALLLTGAIVFNMIALQSCKPKKWEVMQAMQVDKGAEFDGDLYRFVTENIKYPKEAMDNGIEGRVVIGFKIDEDGYVKDPQVVRENYSFANGTNVNDIKPGVLVAAAMDVINKMPRWIPAEKDGRKVAMYFQQPFTFRLPKDSVVGYLYEKASGYGVNGMPVYKSDVKGHHVNDYYKIAMNILNDISGRNSNQNIRKNGYWSMYTEGVSEKEHASIAKIQHEYDSIQLDHLPKQSEVDYQIDKVKGVVYNLSNAKPDRVDGNSASWNLSQMKPDTVYDKK